MKFEFSKLGSVDSGSVTLGDLTVLCGPNNVGKTYVSYSIYGFLRQFRKWLGPSISKKQVDQLVDKGVITVDLEEYRNKLGRRMERAAKDFCKSLPEYFSVPDEFFSNSDIQFSPDLGSLQYPVYKSSITFGDSRQTVHMIKNKDGSDLSISLQTSKDTKVPGDVLRDAISRNVDDSFLFKGFPWPFVVTSERTGAALFYKELDRKKNEIVERVSKSAEGDETITLMERHYSRYARPIQDNIDTIREYEDLSRRDSDIQRDKQKYGAVLDALQALVGGTYSATKNHVAYLPEKERGREQAMVPLYVASSSIKSLFLVDLYVRSLALQKGFLVIDEPELNLHPDNQRKMAHLLARLVNIGVRVLVTTHSDYLVRELNSCIMLNQDVENKDEIMKRGFSQYDLLSPQHVRAYAFNRDHKIHKVEIDEFGMNMKTFDELIFEANDLMDTIYYGVAEKSDD